MICARLVLFLFLVSFLGYGYSGDTLAGQSLKQEYELSVLEKDKALNELTEKIAELGLLHFIVHGEHLQQQINEFEISETNKIGLEKKIFINKELTYKIKAKINFIENLIKNINEVYGCEIVDGNASEGCMNQDKKNEPISTGSEVG